MKYQRFKPSSAFKKRRSKEQHKVTVTRESDGEKSGDIGKAFEKWGNRLILAFNLYKHAEPYILGLINYLQQLM